MSNIEIFEVTDRADLKRFIKVANKPYVNDEAYVIPLMIERIDALAPEKNPYFEHAEVQYFIAVRDGEDVGRISAQIDALAQEKWGPNMGHFGLFEAMDQEVANTLLTTAENWLKARGMTTMQGPWSLSANQEAGLLIEGFDTPPVVMMPHGRPEYAGWVENFGLTKEKDLYAYAVDVSKVSDQTAKRFIAMGKRNKSLIMRRMNMKKFRSEIDIILDIFNEAWADNWGYVPMTEHEIEHMAESLKPIIKADMALICEVDGVPVAFQIAIPDVNHYIADLKGKLLPFGWAKVIYRLFISKRVPRIRVPLMGVRNKYQGRPLGAAMAMTMIDKTREEVKKRDCEFGEMGWILEDNTGMRGILDMLGTHAYKTYRVYEKTIG